MADLQLDIDAIVREVVRRLQESPAAPSAPSSTTGSGPEDNRTLKLCDRVVTLAALNGRLAGIRSVQVASHALVTPAVRPRMDEQQLVARQRRVFYCRGRGSDDLRQLHGSSLTVFPKSTNRRSSSSGVRA